MGQVEVLTRQINFWGSLPRSASYVLEPMLYPKMHIIRRNTSRFFIAWTLPVHYSDSKFLEILPARGTQHTLWCAIGVGAFQGTGMCHPARLIKEGGCVDLSLDTLHLKWPLFLFGSEGSALTLPLFLLSSRIIMLCHCYSTMTKARPLFANILWH